MIEKEQREAERRPITKITHKGEIEIESQEPVKAPEPAEVRRRIERRAAGFLDGRASFNSLLSPSQPEPPPRAAQVPTEPPKTPEKKEEKPEVEIDTTSLHKSHLFDLKCKICTGKPLNTRRVFQKQNKTKKKNTKQTFSCF